MSDDRPPSTDWWYDGPQPPLKGGGRSGASARRKFAGDRVTRAVMMTFGAILLVVFGAFLGGAFDDTPTDAAPQVPVGSGSPEPTSATPVVEEPSDEVNAPSPTPPPSLEPAEPAQPAGGTALDVARSLAVKGRAQANDYDRDHFGQAWADVDRNGCDTRNDVLGRDLGEVKFKPGTRDCVVLAGVLVDPYTGSTIEFQRGPNTSALVQVDHVVALADAWQKGARQWDEERRLAFANDPLNLLAVDGPSNQQKGAGDVATWLPPNRSYWCKYAARVVAVKDRYELWVTEAEGRRIEEILRTCPEQQLPVDA